jgi:hypothetical protein
MPTPSRALVFAASIIFALLLPGSIARAEAPTAAAPAPPVPAATALGTAPAAPNATLLDRVVVRWFAPELGGASMPQFIFERELAFEARLESLADPEPEIGPYRNRHVRAALDRHIAETLLASLPTVPRPRPREVAQRAEEARAILEQRVQGRDRLIAAAAAEGISSDELDGLLRRQARASLYIDRMVAPMLEPNPADLRDLQSGGATPFKGRPFEEVAPALTRWYVGQHLSQAVETYFLNARARITIIVANRPR